MSTINYQINAVENEYLYVEVSLIQNAGKGLFTAIDIYKNEIISVFKGEKLSELEIKKRIKNNTDNYFINMIDGTIMDSKNVECFAKYANDAEVFENSILKNNSKITLNEDNNVCLVAIKKINSGSEIFCSYGKKYWNKHLKSTQPTISI